MVRRWLGVKKSRSPSRLIWWDRKPPGSPPTIFLSHRLLIVRRNSNSSASRLRVPFTCSAQSLLTPLDIGVPFRPKEKAKDVSLALRQQDLIEYYIDVIHKCDWFLAKLVRTTTRSRFVSSGPCSNLSIHYCSAIYLQIWPYSRTPPLPCLASWHGKCHDGV